MAISGSLQRRFSLPALAAMLGVFAFVSNGHTARADAALHAAMPEAALTAQPSGVTPTNGEGAWWRESVAVFATLWDDTRARLADDLPDWLQHLSSKRPGRSMPDASAAYVVLQDDRADGIDLITLRYRLAGSGPLHAYAGAGFNHARYFIDDPATVPSLLNRQTARSDVGATAELGAEFAVSEQVHLNADLRWADIDERADLLHTAHGPVAADPVTIGLSLGYRFR